MEILKKNQGFTLVELMLVVIIIGILVGMIAPRLTGRSRQAREAVGQADINAHLSSALDLFELDIGRYPTTGEGMAALRTVPPGVTRWKGPYLKRPLPMDPWGRPYVYRSPGQHNKEDYDLSSYGPDGVEGNSDDVTNWQ